MSSGGTIDSMLDKIPGYAGYRDKERRRDTDRAVRENLALEYGQLADRLGRLATTLADERKIMAISTVDKPHKRLTAFIDRVRTASYGYAPLFSDAPVDAEALDQIALFDRALADQTETLAQQISTLEATSPDDASFKTAAAAVTATVDGLHERFDKRNEVIHAGKALPQKDIVSYLEPAKPTITTPLAYRLHENEAVSYDGVNYSIMGRVSFESERTGLRAFQLKGGSGDSWLVVASDPAQQTYWAHRSTVIGAVGDDKMIVADETYTLDSVENGKGEVIGASGATSNQPVRLGRYRAASGGGLLFVFDWGTGTLALAGAEANPASLEVFTREK
jgi:hypothetical protein